MLRYVTPLRAAAVLLTLFVVSLPTADAFIVSCYQQDLPKNMVLAIQEELQRRGFDPGPIDGLWGSKSQMAVGAYQNAIGVRNARMLRGIPNGETLRALFGEQFRTETYGLTRNKSIPDDIFDPWRECLYSLR
jgi:hypothetical protein